MRFARLTIYRSTMECVAGAMNPCPGTLTGPASQLFLTLISTLLGSPCSLGPEGRYPIDYAPFLRDGDEFDFIVVGGGSAGSIVTNRLSQVQGWKILLLEAGGYPSAASEVPSFFFSMLETPENWQYVMEPSRTCCVGLRDGVCPCPRGKAIGGSSTVNGMLYIRGNRRDYDSWAAAGNPGWDYDSIVKYFEKFENYQNQNDDQYNIYGELEISRYVYKQPIRKILEEAYRELGYTYYEESKPIGFLDCLMTISQGTRSNTGKAFISKIKDRKNLYVALNAQVGKLLINKVTKTVDQVEVKINNKILKIKAKKEVILSAGAINSPQILMNSGIGPQKHLESLGIEVMQDLGVGEGLQDHLLFPMLVSINKEVLQPITALDLLDEVYRYFMHRQGILGTIELSNFMGLINTKNNSMYPNIQIFKTAHHKNDPYLLAEVIQHLRLPEEVKEIWSKHNNITNSVGLHIALLKPKSRGKILLRSADPFDIPRIFPNYLSDDGDEDLQIVVKGVQIIQKLIQTEAFGKYEPELVDYNITNCKQFVFLTEAYWKCAITNLASNIFHPVGTCKMGPRSDLTSVVDPQLRVHGVNNLRVIDGSVMPIITSGNTNAPIIAIGGKGAELVKEDWMFKEEL